MERVFKLTAVIVALFFTTSTYATIYPIVNAGESKSLTIDLNDWASSDVKIIIRDNNGEILHNDGFAKGSIQKRKYNLANLPSGNYVLVIEGNNKKSVSNFMIAGSKVVFDAEETQFIYKPQFIVKNQSVEINHLALGENVKVTIANANGVFFTKEYADKNTINTSFDISKLPYGSYVMTLSTANQYESVKFTK